MAPANWSTLDGVGFSKKHDAPRHVQPAIPRSTSWVGLRRRRIILPLLALLGIYLFVKNIPTNVAPVGQRVSSLYGSMAPGHVLAHAPELQGLGFGAQHVAEQQYDGSIQFPKLASSLRPHLSMAANKNVLFLMPGLRSASNLLPFACQMSRNNRSSVHMAILGRQDVSVKDILKVNGIAAEDCPVFWHDARPDHPLESSFDRLAASIQAGLGHCCAALRPQLILVDEAAGRDAVLGELIRGVAAATGTRMTILPGDVFQSVPWMGTLDSSSLQKMKEVDIEIVIQARDDSAGPLVRLLHSLHAANYDGLFYPHLTIELPAQIDPFLHDFLKAFRWPPGSLPNESQLTLRHRISHTKFKAEEASLHTVESFYPRTTNSHVLVLAPDAELSPEYFHYLTFTLLEYKYGQDHDDVADSIFGISLETPSKALDDQALHLDRQLSQREVLMLWQAPNSNAALIMGDKWLELRQFLAHRLAHDPVLQSQSKDARTISAKYPSWLREMLDLMQARGQYMIYPAFSPSDSSSQLVTLHQELHQPPEEYARAAEDKKDMMEMSTDEIIHNDVLTGVIKPARPKEVNTFTVAASSVYKLLPHGDKDSAQRLPALEDMPMFSYTGKVMDWERSQSAAGKFADEFSHQQGGCASLNSRDKTKMGSVDYLFCDTD